MTTYTSQYPPEQNDTYVKATTKYDTDRSPYYATDPTKSLIGSSAKGSWIAASGTTTNQRFHIDLGAAAIIRRLYYENFHSNGVSETNGWRNFTMQGSNSSTAFAELTYETDTDWTNLSLESSVLDIHVSADSADPKYILINNSAQYRYYAIKLIDTYGGILAGVRRIELQTEDGYGGVAFIPGAIWF